MIPIRTDSPLRTTPWMNWALIVANVVAFVFQKLNPATAAFSLKPADPQLLHYFTYQFLHDTTSAFPLHLLSNMLFLYIFGNNVNDKMGHLGYLGFYLAGGVFAGIGHMMTSTAPVIGASGAIAAVTGAYLVLFPRSSVTIIYFFIFIGQIEIPSLWFIAFFFAKEIFLNFSGEASGVAHTAHISGGLFGVVICSTLLAVHLLPRDQFDIVALFQRWNKRRQYRDLVSAGYNPFGADERNPRLDAPPDPKTIHIMQLRAQIADAVSRHEIDSATAMYLELRDVDPTQVLARQAQLDIANKLASDQRYREAAQAYEGFMRIYPNYEQMDQVDLMLGLIYARYLEQYPQAKERLIRALARLHSPREIALAKTELERIAPFVTA